MSSAGDWYDSLAKPSWAPAEHWFGPVWTLLYALMAVSAILVARRHAWGAVALLAVQLAVNLAWPVVFFRWHRLWGSVAVIAVLVSLVVLTIVVCWRASPLAGALLLPYLAWIAFATALNVEVARLNPWPAIR